MSGSFSFSCLSCNASFFSEEEHRAHHREDWHRYNLKRKIADLKPITLDQFRALENNAQSQEQHAIQAKKAQSEAKRCVDCAKTFSSLATYDEHLKGKRHLECVRNSVASLSLLDRPARQPKPPRDSVEFETIPDGTDEETARQILERNIAIAPRLQLEQCLFCSCAPFASLSQALDHMTSVHSFFIPDLDFLVDLTGLVKWLGESISVYNCCIYCADRSRVFCSLDAVRKHMIDKGHCKIFYEPDTELEVAQFYDYDLQMECTDVSFGNRVPVISADESELTLPSGQVVGSRAYRIYYKQQFDEPTYREGIEIKRLFEQYRTLGIISDATSGHRAVSSQRSYAQAVQRNQLDIGLTNSRLKRHVRLQII